MAALEHKLSERGASLTGARARIVTILDKFVFTLLLVLLLLVPIPYGSVQDWWVARFECAVFILTAIWLLTCLLRGRFPPANYRLTWPFFLIVIYALIQVLPVGKPRGAIAGVSGFWASISADPVETAIWALKVLSYTLFALLLLATVSSRARFRALVYCAIATGVASAIFGIARQALQGDTIGFVLPLLRPDTGYGQFVNRDHFAFLMEMILGLLLGIILGRGVPRDRVLLFLALLAPVWLALILANSRGGILAMLCQVVLVATWFILRPKGDDDLEDFEDQPAGARRIFTSKIFRTVLLVVLVCVVGFGTIWIGGNPLLQRFETPPGTQSGVKNPEESDTNRLDIWKATWKIFQANPITGVGFGGYAAVISSYLVASGEWAPQQAHNDYLEWLASGGIIGALLGIAGLVVCGGSARAALRSRNDFRGAACIGAITGIAGVAVHSALDFGIHMPANAVLLTVLVVIATVKWRGSDKGHSQYGLG